MNAPNATEPYALNDSLDIVGISPSLLKEGTELSTVHRDDLGSLAMLTEISRGRINEKIFSCLCSSHH